MPSSIPAGPTADISSLGSPVWTPAISAIRLKASPQLSLYSGQPGHPVARPRSVHGIDCRRWQLYPSLPACTPSLAASFTDADATQAALVADTLPGTTSVGARAALGQTLQVENEPLQITGVLPGSFDFPAKTEVWEAFPACGLRRSTNCLRLQSSRAPAHRASPSVRHKPGSTESRAGLKIAYP